MSTQLVALSPALQPYAWGSPTHIPTVMGSEPTGEPVAEAWYGAHAAAPTMLADQRPLSALIESDPIGQLGQRLVDRFGVKLPYLMKLLAAAGPLSIQVHPSVDQAVAGCAREDAAGIDRGAPNRSFRDDNHKPELLCALTRFEALVGFREPVQTLALFEAIGAGPMSPVASTLASKGIGAALRQILTLEREDATEMVAAAVANCRNLAGEWSAHAALLVRLAERYPGDPGVLTAAMLNRIVLEPGQAVYLGAGNLHAYVEGFGVEIMANSDNVLRGGLTPKHMDVPALLEVVDAQPYLPPILDADELTGAFATPAPEFELTCYRGPEGVERTLRGPEILMSVEGPLRVRAGDHEITVEQGAAVWAPAALGNITVHDSALTFVAAVNPA